MVTYCMRFKLISLLFSIHTGSPNSYPKSGCTGELTSHGEAQVKVVHLFKVQSLEQGTGSGRTMV